MPKYIFFTAEGSIYSVAKKLEDEGNDVIVGVVEDLNDTLTDEELKHKKKNEEAEEKRRRLSLYDGMVKKVDATKLLKAMKKIENKADYFVATDSNSLFRYTEIASKLGYTGLLPTQQDRLLEVDRKMAKEIVQKHYPDIEVAEVQEFKSVKDGIKFLEETENVYVLKSLGDSGETVVPKNGDAEMAKRQIIDVLQTSPKDYEANGFLLEQKIMDAVEMTPQMVFLDGVPVFSDVDIETKTLGAAEKGPNKGCGFNLIIQTKLDDKLNKIAFPPYAHEVAKQHKGLFIIDAGLLFDPKSGKVYFTEFCYQRFGWDAFPTELAMSANEKKTATPYFEAVIKGKNPLRKRFGVGVRLFNLNQDDSHNVESNMTILVDDRAASDVYLYDAKSEGERIISAGFQADLAVVTGDSDNILEAIKRCYDCVDMVGFNDVYYRPMDDFLSTSYSQAVLNRLKYAVEKGFIKDEGITDELKQLSGKNVVLENKDVTLEDMASKLIELSKHYNGLDKKYGDAEKLSKDYEAKLTAEKDRYDKSLSEERAKMKDEVKKVKRVVKKIIES